MQNCLGSTFLLWEFVLGFIQKYSSFHVPMLHKDKTGVSWMKDTDSSCCLSIRIKGWECHRVTAFPPVCAFCISMCFSNNKIKSPGIGILVNLSGCLRWVKILVENLMVKLLWKSKVFVYTWLLYQEWDHTDCPHILEPEHLLASQCTELSKGSHRSLFTGRAAVCPSVPQKRVRKYQLSNLTCSFLAWEEENWNELLTKQGGGDPEWKAKIQSKFSQASLCCTHTGWDGDPGTSPGLLRHF